MKKMSDFGSNAFFSVNGGLTRKEIFISDKREIPPKSDPETALKIARRNDRIAKSNLGQIYSGAYAMLFGGKVMHPHIPELDPSNKLLDNYRPDVTKTRKIGSIHTEIKASQKNGTKFVFYKKQVAQYSASLANRAQLHESSQVNFGFFRYSLGRDSLNTLSNLDLLERCADTTGSALVIPINLFFLAWKMGQPETRDHSTSNASNSTAQYWSIPPSFLTSLINSNPLLSGKRLLEDISEHYSENLDKTYYHKRRMVHNKISINKSWLDRKKAQSENAFDFASKYLCLDNIVLDIVYSPPKMRINYSDALIHFNRFPISVYSNLSVEKWTSYFLSNRNKILSNLKIDDLIDENPF